MTPSQRLRWYQCLLVKFPSFDPDWSDAIKEQWQQIFAALKRGGEEAETAEAQGEATPPREDDALIEAAKARLADLMSDISEDCYCAGKVRCERRMAMAATAHRRRCDPDGEER